jgi:hypothetical protein
MLPRDKLIQCFTCKNNLACWGLNEDIPLGVNERDFSIPTKALTFLISKNMDEECSIGDQFGMFCIAFLKTLRHDDTATRRDVYQLVSVLAALANTPNDGWECPGEDPENKERFVYEVM